MNGVADLHMHTTASDGKSTVSERTEQAKRRDLEAISITDHDRIADELDTPVYMSEGLEVITGVEIRTEIFDTKVEILGYYINPRNHTLQNTLEEIRSYRNERNRILVEELTETTGLNVSYADMVENSQGQLGRPHFADALIDENIVDSVSEAFDRYLGKDGECYVPMERAEYIQVISAIHEAGGVASLAHPGRIDSERVPEMVAKMAEEELDGIEVWYPYGNITHSRKSDVRSEKALALAKKYDLLRTGGSDCHGEGSGKFRIGEVRTPVEDLNCLRKLSGSV